MLRFHHLRCPHHQTEIAKTGCEREAPEQEPGYAFFLHGGALDCSLEGAWHMHFSSGGGGSEQELEQELEQEA